MDKHAISFKMAFSGIRYVLGTQPNMRIHGGITLFVILGGLSFHLSSIEWVAVALAIAAVFSAEMINTAIESMTDLITTEYHSQAKVAKDVSAGMVLVVALAAAAIGILVFGPKILSLLKN